MLINLALKFRIQSRIERLFILINSGHPWLSLYRASIFLTRVDGYGLRASGGIPGNIMLHRGCSYLHFNWVRFLFVTALVRRVRGRRRARRAPGLRRGVTASS